MTVFIMCAMAAATKAPGAQLRATYLRCEYLVNPIVVDQAAPRLSWELQGPGRGVRQSAYRILAAADRARLRPGQADLWDSGKVTSSATWQIAYGGKTPRPTQRVWWAVQVWDGADRPSPWSQPAEWTRGIGGSWRAEWIGDPREYPEPASARNGYHTEIAERPATEKWVRIDLKDAAGVDGVRLWPARPYDWQPDTPGFLFPLRFRVEGAMIESGPYQTLLDSTAADVPSPGQEALTLRFPRASVRHLRLTATALRERDPGKFGMALAEMEGLDGETVVTAGAAVSALDSIETGSWAKANLTDGDRKSHPEHGADALPPIMLRREFDLARVPPRAVLFASALGAYEVRINGRRVGDHLLAPEWTDYRQRVQYQGYDVTSLLRPGRNAIGAMVGDGWHAGRIGLFPGRGHYGRRPEFRAEMRAEGAAEPLVLTDGAWGMTTDGPVRTSDILDGEAYDARHEIAAWDRPGFDDAAWKAVAVAHHPGLAMAGQPNEPIRITSDLRAVALSQPSHGVHVFDLGQNMVGWVRLKLQAPASTVIRLRHAEMLNDDGTIYTTNLRGAPQVDTYTCRGGGVEVFEPHFTYHGFRYVEVTGLPTAPKLGDLTGRVFNSSSPEVGTFECSDPSLNRLWLNILWTQRANLMSTPTDCPQRDERLGWMGDIQAFGQTACYNMDLAAFFTKWLQDVRDAQADDGRFPDFAPNPADSNERFSGVPAWGDAGVLIPWLVYTTYGDERILERHYPAVVRWIEYIHGQNPDLIWRNGRHADYNDWLNADTLIADGWPKKGGEVPREVFATAFWANSTRIAARMAERLAKADDARRFGRLADEIRQAFNKAFVSADGTIEGDTQAGYALALHFELLPEELRAKALQHMLAGIEAYGGHISTGIQSTHRMMLELTRSGRSDAAYKLLLNRTFPSWLYSVDNGATTIWERWDGYVKGRGFQNPGMNSFNHWALGAVGEWMMKTIIGLCPDPGEVAWRRFIVRPEPGGGLTHASGSYRSVSGLIKAGWRIGEGRFTLDLTVPPNCTARVRLPSRAMDTVTEGGKPLKGADGVRVIDADDGRVWLEAPSGAYRFVCSYSG